jgi:hypothetical protein
MYALGLSEVKTKIAKLVQSPILKPKQIVPGTPHGCAHSHGCTRGRSRVYYILYNI